MNIHKIQFDLLHYTQTSLEIEDESRWVLDHALWSYSPLLVDWQPLKLAQLKSKLKLGDFFTFYTGGVLGVAAHVLEIDEIKQALLSSGELLPIVVDGKPAFLFHCLHEADNLAWEMCKKRQLTNGKWVVHEPVFLSSWTTVRRFFCIPGSASMYCAGDNQWDFADCCKRHHLKGLELTPQRVVPDGR